MKSSATEHEEQVQLFQLAALHLGRYPELCMMYAIPNGGHRSAITGAHLKAEGVKRGVPDICLPVARGGWNGLYIEMKRKGKYHYPTREQTDWLFRLGKEGHWAQVCYGSDQAWSVIKQYLEG